MLQRAKGVQSMKRANQLLTMRDQMASQLGEKYRPSIETYLPFVSAAAQRCGCAITAANQVIDLLGDIGEDIAVKRLVTCAAVELALGNLQVAA